MGFLLHFFPADAARDLVSSYVTALAPGSYVVLSAGRGDSERADSGFGAYSTGGTRVYNHPVAGIPRELLGSLKLIPPGVVDGAGSGARTGNSPCTSRPVRARSS